MEWRRELHTLARLSGVQVSYTTIEKKRVEATQEALLAVLRAWGHPIASVRDIASVRRHHELSQCRRPLPPVVVAWEGKCDDLCLRLNDTHPLSPMEAYLEDEAGTRTRFLIVPSQLPVEARFRVAGHCFETWKISLPQPLDYGYYWLTLHLHDEISKTLIISAPSRAFISEEQTRQWGIFAPVYALHSEHSWGAGDLGDLERLMTWANAQGASVIGTLPLLAQYLSVPFEPSPYSPVSRMFWNEFYIDVSRVPEFQSCLRARVLVESPQFCSRVSELRQASVVDYRRQMALKREILALLAEELFSQVCLERYNAFQEFVTHTPMLADYARFRAVAEAMSCGPCQWSERLREGKFLESDYDESARRYHLYSQWIMSQQLSEVGTKAAERDMQLYLDFPLGVTLDSFDVWSQPHLFVLDVAGGAPPDPFFVRGQQWGFPPLHPERIREDGYRYFIASLRTELAHAKLLRIDHIMGLHRLFWVPKEMEARQGVYVHYHADEFYAILCLESHRHRAVIAGENLGTVPSYVNRDMRRHGIEQLYVLQYEVEPNRMSGIKPVPRQSVASLNTHDMPPFAAFWKATDIALRKALGYLDEAVCAALRTALHYLARSDAHVVLLALEDLWQEEAPQNVPGTGDNYPNWQRKCRLSLEEIAERAFIASLLEEIKNARSRT